MSRIANAPVEIPAGVEVALNGSEVTVKGSKGTLSRTFHADVEVSQEGSALKTVAKNNSKQAVALTGTARALISNMVDGVSKGFEKKLTLVFHILFNMMCRLVLQLKPQVKQKLLLRALTNKRSDKWLQIFVLIAHLNLIKVKVFVILMNMLLVKKLRKNN